MLFPTVKTALLVAGHRRGERPEGREWLGAVLSVSGLVALTAPGASRPDLPGVLLMALAGLAWAAYTLAGRTTSTPLSTTRDNFARATIVSLPLLAGIASAGHVTPAGLALAALSGAVTSAIPYVIWYRVVPHLTGMQLGLAQLSVPMLASAGAVALLGEPMTARLVCGALLIGAGVLVAAAPYRRLRRR